MKAVGGGTLRSVDRHRVWATGRDLSPDWFGAGGRAPQRCGRFAIWSRTILAGCSGALDSA